VTQGVDFQPAWMTEELHQALAAIGGHNQRKKRTTVLRLAEARATGKVEGNVFKDPACCGRNCWYGKQPCAGVHLPGWRDDPAIQAALEAAVKRAQWFQDQAETRRIAKRQEQMADAKELLCEYAPHAAKRLFLLMGQAESEETRRKAANDILDRAGGETASKASLIHVIGGVNLDDI
jgi:hypothetical protein